MLLVIINSSVQNSIRENIRTEILTKEFSDMNNLIYEKEYIFFKKLADRFQIPVHEVKQSTLAYLGKQDLSFLIADSQEERNKLFLIMEMHIVQKRLYLNLNVF